MAIDYSKYKYELPEDDETISGQIKKAANAALDAQAASVAQTVGEYEAQRAGIADTLKNNNAAAERVYKEGINPYGSNSQALKSAGLAGSGFAETTKAGIANTYQNNLTQNKKVSDLSERDINLAITAAKQRGDIAAATLLQDYATQLASQKYTEQRDTVADTRYADETAYSRGIDKRNYDYQIGRDAVDDSRYADETAYSRGIDKRNYDYQIGRDAVADNRYTDETAYDRGIDLRNYGYQLARDDIADMRYTDETAYSRGIDGRNYDYQLARDAVADKQDDRTLAYNEQNAKIAQALELLDRGYSNGAIKATLGLTDDEIEAAKLAASEATGATGEGNGNIDNLGTGGLLFSDSGTTPDTTSKTTPNTQLQAVFGKIKQAAPNGTSNELISAFTSYPAADRMRLWESYTGAYGDEMDDATWLAVDNALRNTVTHGGSGGRIE